MVTVVALAAGLLATAPATAAVDSRWSGYRIDGPGRAAGSWIGGYRLPDGAKAYRLNPSSAGPTGTLGPVRKAKSFAGATDRAVSRAAFILSRYGAVAHAARSAAVDAAVLHLLSGGRWKVTAKAGGGRIALAAHPARVRRHARAMLAESLREAGPYQVTLTAGDAVRPGGFGVRVAVHTAAGEPVVGAPVRAIVNGAGNVLTRTGPDGSALATWTTTDGVRLGQHRVRVEVRQLHESRLILRKPTTGTTLALGGWKQALIRHTQMIVKARPRVSVAPAGTITQGKTYRTRVRVTGSVRGPSRKAGIRLYGPFESRAAARCGGHLVRSFRRATTGNGTWVAAQVKVNRTGYYRWATTLPGNRWNAAVRRCDNVVRAR